MSSEEPERREFMRRLTASAALIPRGRGAGYAAPKPNPGNHVLNILDFGAVGDGRTLTTSAIQAAVDACGNVGGGRVVIPPGRYLTGPIFLKSNLEVEILAGATVLGSTKFSDYPTMQGWWEGVERRIHASMFTGVGLDNVSIYGRGVLDGQGAVWLEAWGKTEERRKKLGIVGREPENPPGSPLLWPRPRMINLSSFIAFHARRTPARVALKYRGEDIFYAAFDDRIRKVAGWLVTRGIGPDDVVAVLMKNSTAFLELAFAASHIGAVFLPLNTRLTVPELQYIVGDAAPVLMIHDAELADVALSVAKLCSVRSALLLGPDGSYEAAIAASRALDQAEIVTLDDISTIMYTSGTTGQPKGAIITHGMTFWNCVNLGGPAYIPPSSVLLTVLPLFHTGGLNVLATPLFYAGGTVVVAPRFDAVLSFLALEPVGDPRRRA